MTHRVLLDFAFDADLLGTLPSGTRVSDPNTAASEPPFIGKLRRHLVQTDWESQSEDEATAIFNRMAEQLPDDDLASFVRHSKLVMDRKAPKAYLTVGYFQDAGIGRLRLRIGAASEAVLVDLGRIVANGLIDALPQLELRKMEVFEGRSDTALLSGSEHTQGEVLSRFYSNENRLVWIPFTFSVVFLFLGMFLLWINHPPWDKDFFSGGFGQWYDKLVGPTAMVIVTTMAIATNERRRIPERRFVEWDLQSGPQN